MATLHFQFNTGYWFAWIACNIPDRSVNGCAAAVRTACVTPVFVSNVSSEIASEQEPVEAGTVCWTLGTTMPRKPVKPVIENGSGAEKTWPEVAILNGTGEPMVLPVASLNEIVPVQAVGGAIGGVAVVTRVVVVVLVPELGLMAEKLPARYAAVGTADWLITLI